MDWLSEGTSGPGVEAPSSLKASLHARPYRVMAVDDDESFRTLLSRVLTFRDPFECRVEVFPDAAAAFQALGSATPDLVLSDHVMPGEDGVAFLTRVKEAYPTVIRVLMTAHTDMGSLLGAVVESEAHGYIEKPIDAQLVPYTLYDLLLRRQVEQGRGDAASPSGRPATVTEVLRGIPPRRSS